MTPLEFSYDIIMEQTKMFRATFGRDPKYLAYTSSSKNPEAAVNMMADNLYLGVLNSGYKGCLNGLQYALEYGNFTPARYIDALIDGNVITFFKFMEPEADTQMSFTQIGHCKCCVHEKGPVGPVIIFDSLSLCQNFYTEEDTQDIMRILYIEAARFQLRHPKLPIAELRFDFPMLGWTMEKDVQFFGEFKILRAMVSMAKVIGNSDSEDRFAEDYNPHNIKMMRLLPTDVFTVPDSIIELIDESRRFMQKEMIVSRALTPSAATIEQIRKNVANRDSRRSLITAVCSSDVRHLIFFIDNEPIGFMQYEQEKGAPTHLHLLYVKEAYRGKGYGTWIIRQFFAEVYLSRDSLPIVQLEVFMGEDVAKLLAFYRKHGFEPYGQVFNKRITKSEFRKLADAKE